jgi:methionyl aminopeptidase
MPIQFKSEAQVQAMRMAGIIVGETLELLRSKIVIGITTNELDALAEEHIRMRGAIPSFMGYHGFPATICASVNDEIVHGIPSDRAIMDGDVVSIDCGAILNGWHGDAAFTVGVGQVDPKDQALIDTCESSLWAGIAAAQIGGHLSDIGHAVERVIKSRGRYGILQEYGGHGIGTEMHQDPHVLNYGKRGRGPELVPGLVLAVEPMITRGSNRNRVLADEWTVVSTDGSRAAHFEQTFTLMGDGRPYVLTSLDGGKSALSVLGVEAYAD